MCTLFSGGRHIATAAVLYDAEAEWAGERMAMQKAGRELLEHQIDFDVVSTDMLYQEAEYYRTRVEDGKLKVNEESFDVLVVPYAERITRELAQFIEQNPQFPVWFIEALPKQIVNGDPSDTQEESRLMEAVRSCTVVLLEKLADRMKEEGYFELSLKEEFPSLSTYHYRTDRDLFFVMNESAEKTFCGEICLCLLYTSPSPRDRG